MTLCLGARKLTGCVVAHLVACNRECYLYLHSHEKVARHPRISWWTITLWLLKGCESPSLLGLTIILSLLGMIKIISLLGLTMIISLLGLIKILTLLGLIKNPIPTGIDQKFILTGIDQDFIPTRLAINKAFQVTLYVFPNLNINEGYITLGKPSLLVVFLLWQSVHFKESVMKHLTCGRYAVKQGSKSTFLNSWISSPSDYKTAWICCEFWSLQITNMVCTTTI